MTANEMLVVLLFICTLRFTNVSTRRMSLTSGQSRRITNAEVNLAAITHDVAVFRLDMIDIWDLLIQLNNSICENPVKLKQMSERKPEAPTGNNPVMRIYEAPAGNDLVLRIYSAFTQEKTESRRGFQSINENINNFQMQTDETIKVILSKQEKNIESTEQALNALDKCKEATVNEQGKKIENMEQALNALKIIVNEQGEKIEHTDEAMKTLIRYANKQEEMIETLENEVKSFKQAVDANEKEMNDLKVKLANQLKWHNYMGSYYYLGMSTLTWTEAEEDCQKEGAHLVEFDDTDEVVFVYKLALSLNENWNTSKYTGFWVGASDIEKEGNWIWSRSGKNVGKGFTKWHQWQPDNYKGKEDCMMSCVNLQGNWNDDVCDLGMSYMCEKELF